jgi:hypothetical protein
MPLELHIIRATDFVRVDPQGHFDLAASKAALALLAGACRKRGINQALMDLRALQPGPKPVFTPADLVELVNTFGEVGFTHRERLAILYHSDPHKRARLFAFLSTIRGWNVRAFGDFEKALLWLSSSQESPSKPKRSPAEKQIPIRVRNQEANPPPRSACPRARRKNEPSRRKRAISAVHRAPLSA